MALDVQLLLDRWSDAERIFRPRPGLFLPGDPLAPVLVELSLMSGRVEFWEPYVCLLGSVQVFHQPPMQVLTTTVQQLMAGQGAGLASNVMFLGYAGQFRLQTRESFIPVLGALHGLFLRLGFAGNDVTIERFEECYRNHYPDIDAIIACLRSK
jgi:hypothetical protein